jgi:Ni2+-binding GTPase involved in maturation of urease and hydrogenase
MEIVRLSCTTGEGLNEWFTWLEKRRQAAREPRAATI